MDKAHPTLDILISTVAPMVDSITEMMLPEREGVRYIISVQYTTDEPPVLSTQITSRTDVTTGFLQGSGLSRNRNNALRMSRADICLIADDDNRYTTEYIDTILNSWNENPDADILTFMAQSYEGEPLHPYPAPYICSQEITLKRNSIISNSIFFDERFGLGSPLLCSGEEDVFIHDARKAGLTVKFIPKVIVRTDKFTTGIRFISDRKVQITKGATFRYIYGTGNAIWRSFKEAGWYLFHKGANPFPILFNMLKGIWILQ